MQLKKLNEEDLETVKAELREWLPKNTTTIYTILRKRARSGMQRTISMVIFEVQQELLPDCAHSFHHVASPSFIDYKVAQVLGYSLDENQGMKVRGAGMDMGFHLVESLGRALYNDGRAFHHRWL